LLLSLSSNRSSPTNLQGSTVAGDIYVFLSPDTGVSKTRFYIDDPTFTGTPYKIEKSAPLDLAGTSTGGLALPFDTTLLTNGSHQISARSELTAGGEEIVHASMTVDNDGSPPPPPPPPPDSDYDLRLSLSPNRSAPVDLEGQVVEGDIYVFVAPESDLKKAQFYVDDPGTTSTPHTIEKGAPYDLGGTESSGAAKPFDATALGQGPHNVTVILTKQDSSKETVGANFQVSTDPSPSLTLSPSALSFALDPNESEAQSLALGTNDGTSTSFSVADDAPWLTVAPASGTAPSTLTATVNTAGLTPGIYAATIVAQAPGYNPAVVGVELNVGAAPADCTPLPCGEILIDLPYEMNFASNHGKILDAAGIGTGFTYIDQPSKGTGYIPGKLHMDTADGVLRIDTTAGLNSEGSNSQDNALGVGIDAPSQNTLISTTLVNPPAGTGKFEQAGLYFGVDDDNFSKFVVSSTSKGTKIEHLVEVNSNKADRSTSSALNLASSEVTLELHTNPAQRTVTGTYRIDGGPPQIDPVGTGHSPLCWVGV
jgi:hypothetical protein